MRGKQTGTQTLKDDEINFFRFFLFRCWLRILYAEPNTPKAEAALKFLKQHHPNGANGMSALQVAVWVDVGADLDKATDNIELFLPGPRLWECDATNENLVQPQSWEIDLSAAVMARFRACHLVSAMHMQIGHVHVFVVDGDNEDLQAGTMSTTSANAAMKEFLTEATSACRANLFNAAAALFGRHDLAAGRAFLSFLAEDGELLSKCYIEGNPVIELAHFASATEDEVRAAVTAVNTSFHVDRWRRMAEGNDGMSMLKLATCYDRGFGTPKDLRKATELYEAAAELGDKKVQASVAECYRQRLEPDYSSALRWSTAAAKQGCMFSQHLVGLAYLKGEGVERNASEAAEWFQMAIEQSYAPSQHILAQMLIKGDGVEKDVKEAQRLVKAAIDSKSLAAERLDLAVNLQEHIATLLSDSEAGISQ